MNGKLIKVLSMSATVVGIGASLLSDWVGDKKLDAKISEKVSKAIANLNEKES